MKFFNEAGEEIMSVSGYAKANELNIPTVGNQVEKAQAAGEAVIQGQQGKTVYFRVTDIAAAIAKYGRKAKPKPVPREDYDSLQALYYERGVESARQADRIKALESRLRETNERIEALKAELKDARAYTNSNITGESAPDDASEITTFETAIDNPFETGTNVTEISGGLFEVS